MVEGVRLHSELAAEVGSLVHVVLFHRREMCKCVGVMENHTSAPGSCSGQAHIAGPVSL